jgi:hypothetical protein
MEIPDREGGLMKKAIIAAITGAILITQPVLAEEMSREVDSDLFNVAHLMMGEAGYTDSQERRWTASVLLNRVGSDKFPDTIGECLYQPGQYITVRDGGPFWMEPTEECWNDAEELLTQWYETGETDLPEDVLYQSRGPLGYGTYLVSSWGQYFCYG